MMIHEGCFVVYFGGSAEKGPQGQPSPSKAPVRSSPSLCLSLSLALTLVDPKALGL